jgi:hypothetical protein
MKEIFLWDSIAYFSLILLTGLTVVASADSFSFKWKYESKKLKLKTLADIVWIIAIANIHLIAWSHF